MNHNLFIDAQNESEKIISFLKQIFSKTGKQHAVLGWSGGIDSTVCLYLLVKALRPKQVFVYHLPYQKTYINELIQLSKQLRIPKKNITELAIKKMVDVVSRTLSATESMRRGNIMARLRMTTLFDQAKSHDALVCGTENRSEHLLGYFTRYGDSASDIEPVCHLYKTQIYQLARYLGVSETIIQRSPTADLWTGQTDEGELGFSYKEADEVLYNYFNKKQNLDEIKKMGFKNAEIIINKVKQNSFKLHVPYVVK